VLDSLNKLKKDEIYEIRSSFIPAPLIDKSTSLGFQHWINSEKQNDFKIYFMK
jgi:hypothetical protein